ncbi:hypothetical protein [Variovorax terrae]|uniref:MgtC-like C-terminal domain-containing protein n=1 Tax=Variovorax terrae TaxID=2923278 RepID=A0A9X1VZS8_9BURK|nr:hypothetical protein [Variovorax terrae]MCJ0765062.1 hypothetical protein [Variovorax terrae]
MNHFVELVAGKEHAMRLMEWTTAGAGRATGAAAKTGALPLYRLSVACLGPAAPRLEQQIRGEAGQGRLELLRLVAAPLEGRALTQLTAWVKGSPEARRELVGMVQRLGREPQVRSVRWECVPQPVDLH